VKSCVFAVAQNLRGMHAGEATPVFRALFRAVEYRLPTTRRALMETTKAEGVVREAVGNVQETVGNVIGDAGEQLSGKAKALCGKSQQLYADAVEVARDSMVEKPMATLAIAAAAGFALGVLWSWNRGDPDR
jgi:uncharacterized protein YjbJ (UPF0337 family)